MPLITKKIVSSGVFRLANGSLAVIPPERLHHWAAEFGRYRKAGNQLPAPWSHIDPVTKQPIVMGPHLERSDINAGFWENLRVEKDQELGDVLVGDLDIPGDINDPNTPAGKVGKTVRETSIFAADFQDGKSNQYTDIPLHIALVTHAIEPNQKNFVPAIAMSQMAYTMMAMPPGASNDKSRPPSTQPKPGQNDQDRSDPGRQPIQPNATAPGVDQVIQLLRQCGIALPQDTTDANFLERLVVALGQKSMSDGGDDEGSPYQQPEGATQKQPAPVAMSQITPEMFQSITAEVFMSHPAAQALKTANEQLMAHVNAQAQQARQLRVDSLVGSGRITKEYAEATLKPMVASFQMSFGANAPPSALDATLAALESLPQPAARTPAWNNPLLTPSAALAMSQMPAGAAVVTPPGSEQFDPSKIVEQFCNQNPAYFK